MHRHARIEVKRSDSSRVGYFWHAKSSNGEIQAHGELHPSRSNAKRAASDFLTGTCVQLLRAMGWTVEPPSKEADRA